MQYDLVFEGGGAKGMVFVGAMQEFEAAGHTYDRLLGTSAGAITAALLAAGYTSQRMLEALDEKDPGGQPIFAGFMGIPGPFDDASIQASATLELLEQVDFSWVPDVVEKKVDRWIVDALLGIEKYRHVFSFVEQGGWFAASRFRRWMTEKLDAAADGSRTGYGAMSLAEFFDATGKELCLVASDTTAQRLLVLNHRTAPRCPLVWAVRMSMSIPLVWREVEWRQEWGLYRDQETAGHVVVDGGILSNFPIELLLSNQPQVTGVMGDKKSQHVLGLLIDENLPVAGAPPQDAGGGGFEWGRLRTVKRLSALIDTMTKAHDKQVIEAFEQLVARLPAQGYGTTEFAMSPERRDALVKAGREAMQGYFTRLEATVPLPESAPLSPEARQASIADRLAAGILGSSK